MLARKGDAELSQETKDKLADILIKKFVSSLGKLDDLTIENIETHDSMNWKHESVLEVAKSALDEGYDIVEGYLCFSQLQMPATN